MFNTEQPTPKEVYQEAMDELRRKILDEIEQKVRERIARNPKPTEEELYVGAFREHLEPQVRDAIFEFFRKGYATESSGFDRGTSQVVDGLFEIDDATKTKLKALGVSVLKGPERGLPYAERTRTYITFEPGTLDISEIKRKWDAVADILPILEKPAGPSLSLGSDDFRREFASERVDILELAAQRGAALETQEKPLMSLEEIENLKIALAHVPEHHPEIRLTWEERLRELEGVQEQSDNHTIARDPVKLSRWDEITRETNGIRDAVGKSIDVGIKDMVIGLRVLGFETTQSCEGHVDYGRAAPSIDIGAPNEPEYRFKEEREVFEETAKRYGLKFEEVRRSWPEDDSDPARVKLAQQAWGEAIQLAAQKGVTDEYKRWMVEAEKERDRLTAFVDEFYSSHIPVSPDARLKISRDVMEGFSISNGGEDSMMPHTAEIEGTKLTAEQKAVLSRKLSEYQTEMSAFTEFLKHKYFS